jgi:hypothetical protein
VIADERGHDVGHIGEHNDEFRRAVHDAPQVHTVIVPVRRFRASGPASAVVASRSCSAAAVVLVVKLVLVVKVVLVVERHRGGDVQVPRVGCGSR